MGLLSILLKWDVDERLVFCTSMVMDCPQKYVIVVCKFYKLFNEIRVGVASGGSLYGWPIMQNISGLSQAL